MLGRLTGGVIARLVLATVVFLAGAGGSQAAPFLTFVSANGNDAGQCAVTAPCKTLQRAINVSAANGTVKILTPLQGGASIAKSISIVGEQVPFVGQLSITGATTVVTVQGLMMNGVGAVGSGIYIASAKAVYIEDCTLERYTSDGIKLIATTATKLFITNTVARANGSNGLYTDDLNAQVNIENARFDGNYSTGLYLKVAKAVVRNSVASGNGSNGLASRSAILRVTDTRADGNSAHGFVLYEGQGILSSVEGSGNGGRDLRLEGGISTTFFVTDSFLEKFDNAGTLLSTENNLLVLPYGDPVTNTDFD